MLFIPYGSQLVYNNNTYNTTFNHRHPRPHQRAAAVYKTVTSLVLLSCYSNLYGNREPAFGSTSRSTAAAYSLQLTAYIHIHTHTDIPTSTYVHVLYIHPYHTSQYHTYPPTYVHISSCSVLTPRTLSPVSFEVNVAVVLSVPRPARR